VAPPLRVNKGALLAYRVFDVGNEIALDAASLACKHLNPRRATLAADTNEALSLAEPPIVVDLGERTLHLRRTETTWRAEVRARVFNYGAVSVLFEIAIPKGTDLGELLPMCDELYDSPDVDDAARLDVDGLLKKLGDAVQQPHGWRGAETYTVIFVSELEKSMSAKEILAWPALARLLIGEPRDKSLSADESRDVLKHAHSYFDDDLAVIDWNSALVVEPSASRAIPDILEFATSQLLELRYYDGVFDRELARIYDDLGEVRQRPFAVVRDPYSRLARAVLLRLVELTEFTERVDNALKVVGDFYLARVYQSAVRRFRIAAWQQSVDGKQQLIAQAYGFIKGEIESRRSTLLEIIVIVLILAELVTALRH
jgi:hypothetical protein